MVNRKILVHLQKEIHQYKGKTEEPLGNRENAGEVKGFYYFLSPWSPGNSYMAQAYFMG